MGIKAYIYTFFCAFFYHNLLSHAVVKAHISVVVVFNIHFFYDFSSVSFVSHANGQICTLRVIHIKITRAFFTNKRLFILRIFLAVCCCCYLVLGFFLLVFKNVQQFLIVFFRMFRVLFFLLLYTIARKIFYYAVPLECKFMEFYLCNGKAFENLMELTQVVSLRSL